MTKLKINSEDSEKIKSLIENRKTIINLKSTIKTIESAIENEQNKMESILKTKPMLLTKTREEVLAQIALGELEKGSLLEFENEFEKQKKSFSEYEKQLTDVTDTLNGLVNRLELEKKHLKQKESEVRESFLAIIDSFFNKIGKNYYNNLISLMGNYNQLYYYAELMKRLGKLHSIRRKEENLDTDYIDVTSYDKELVTKSSGQIKAPMFNIPIFKELIEIRKSSLLPEPGCFTDLLYRISHEVNDVDFYNNAKTDFASLGLDFDYFINFF